MARPKIKIDSELLRKLCDENCSYKIIAKRMGLSKSSAYNSCRRLEIVKADCDAGRPLKSSINRL